MYFFHPSVALSSLLWFIVVVFVFCSCHFLDECDHLFWSVIPSQILCGNILQCLFTRAMALYHCHHGLLLFYFSLLLIPGWMQTLVLITNSIGSTCLSYHITSSVEVGDIEWPFIVILYATSMLLYPFTVTIQLNHLFFFFISN